MTDVAVRFGANRTRAQDEMTEVLKFEMRLVDVCVPKKNHSLGHFCNFAQFFSRSIYAIMIIPNQQFKSFNHISLT